MNWQTSLLLLLAGCFPGRNVDESPGSKQPGSADTSADLTDTADSGATPCTDGDGDCFTKAEGDCDETNADVFPGQTEVCNNIDDNCDGNVDEGVGAMYYADADRDGFGNPDSTTTSCEHPPDTADNGADCDDEDPDQNPAAEEVSNGEDDDCDGAVDEGLPVSPTLDSVLVTWNGTGATVAVTGSATGWNLGMAETGASDQGWYGETCIPGAEPWGYDDHGWDVCHTLGATGGRVTHVSAPVDVVDGDTLFTQTIAAAGTITFILFTDDAEACWVWGDDVSYYDDFGCTEL